MSRHTYDDRAEWLEARRTGIFASEIAALYNLGFVSQAALQVAKLEGLPTPETDAMRIGRQIEPFLAEMAAEALGVKFQKYPRRPKFTVYRHKYIPLLGATPDRIAVRPPEGRVVIELKNVGQWHAAEWEDEPPLHYQIQIQAQMFCVGIKRGYLCALIGGQRFVTHPVTLNEKFCADMAGRAVAWWQRHIVERQPVADDPDAAAAARILSLRHPDDDGLAIQLPYNAMAAAEQLTVIKDQIRDLENQKTGIENLFKRALGPHSYGVLPDGACVSWKTQETAGYVVKSRKSRVLRFSNKAPRRLEYVTDNEPIEFRLGTETAVDGNEPRDTSDDDRRALPAG